MVSAITPPLHHLPHMEHILASSGDSICSLLHDVRVAILDRTGTVAERAPARCLSVGDRFIIHGLPGTIWLATTAQQLRDTSNTQL